YYIYEEIAQSPSSNTVKVLNGQAVCNIHLGRYPEAENLLLRVEALNKSKSDPDTLVNLIVVSNLIGKPTEVVNRQLKEVAPNHVFYKTLILKRVYLVVLPEICSRIGIHGYLNYFAFDVNLNG
ncbi:coatomer epsilon subunit-domain-containing protein, partial [Gigaspora rosea]